MSGDDKFETSLPLIVRTNMTLSSCWPRKITFHFRLRDLRVGSLVSSTQEKIPKIFVDCLVKKPRVLLSPR